MTEIQPKLMVIKPFDGMQGASIYFTYFGSKQGTENNLFIKEKDTGLAVYNFNFKGYEKVHHLPPNGIANGKTYVAKIRVKFLDGTYSPYSNEVEFHAVRTPILDIENIDGQGYVYNSDVTFIARYSQEHNEPVKKYRFSLYDENEDLIQNYPLRTPVDEAGIVLTETITGLEKGKGYFIDCHIETKKGFIWSHREKFIPIYIIPSLNGVIQTRNDSDEGFVRVTANLKQILASQVRATDPDDTYISDNYKYEDDDWVVVPKSNPLVFKGLGMNRASDFIMKIWCKDVPINSMFLELRTKHGDGLPIKFYRYKDRIVAEKTYAEVTSRHVSNIVSIPVDREFMLYAKVIEHRIELVLRIM